MDNKYRNNLKKDVYTLKKMLRTQLLPIFTNIYQEPLANTYAAYNVSTHLGLWVIF